MVTRAARMTAFGETAAGLMPKRHQAHGYTGGSVFGRCHVQKIIAGTKAGRRSPEEVTLFKSVGVAMKDVARAGIVYREALAARLPVSWRPPPCLTCSRLPNCLLPMPCKTTR